MNNEKAFAEELRKRYTNNPPEGMTAKDILAMSRMIYWTCITS